MLFYYLPRLFVTETRSVFFVSGIVLAAVNLHHFFVDGVIWKLRSEAVVSPLLENVRDAVMKKRAPT